MNDQEIEIIDSLNRSQKIKNFFKNNLKIILTLILLILITILGYFVFIEFQEDKREKISNLYKNTIINFNENNKNKTLSNLEDIIKKNDDTYSPLALYFIIENNLISSQDKVNEYFDKIIYDLSLNKTIKNLNIYKKALYNSDFQSGDELLKILDPLIKSENTWRSHSLYLMAEYYFSKNQKQKSKEFYEKIVKMEDANKDIKLEAQKRLQRDFSD